MIGAAQPRIDGKAQVSGAAKFGVDIRLPGLLEGRILRSPLPHARIVRVETGKAARLKGVYAILTAAEVSEKRYGRVVEDMEFLASDRVRFRGDRVVALAARDRDTAEEALELITVEYEELPAVFDPIEAMQPGAPIVHEEAASYGGIMFPSELPNVCSEQVVEKGSIEEGFAQAERIFEHTFTTPVAHHCTVEGHASVAQFDATGKLTIWTSTQSPHSIRQTLSKVLELPLSQVRVIGTYCGGGFGSKGYIMDEALCALLSQRAAGRPVRMVMTREEEFDAACPRNASLMRLKTGVRLDGTLTARQASVIFDTGVSAGQKPSATPLGFRRVLGPYHIPHVRIDAYCVYTNKIPGGNCRAPGDPQVNFACESQIDMIAQELGLDPLEMRLRNAPREGEPNAVGDVWNGIGFSGLLGSASAKFGWRPSKTAPGTPGKARRKVRGIGMACSERSTAPGAAGAYLTVNADGTVCLLTGACDVGTGTDTLLAQIVASELELSIKDVSVSSRDTEHTPFDTGSGGSRETYVAGNAVLLAVRDAKTQLLTTAAALLEALEGDVQLSNGRVSVVGSPDQGLSIREIAAAAYRKAGGPILGRGSFVATAPVGPVFAAHFVEVEVDVETGQVQVLRYLAAHDLGKTINRTATSGQIEGGAAQGIGFGLMEEMVFDNGIVQNPNFVDYKIPMALDLPNIEAMMVEDTLGQGPFGAKSIGEPPVVPSGAALANALFDATGLRLHDLPLTQERVLAAIQARGIGSDDR